MFDTNVLVSAALFQDSQPGRALQEARRSGIILASLPTLRELQEVLNRHKFDRYLTAEVRADFMRSIMNEAELVEILEAVTLCRDPKDDKFLEVVANGHATHLITGDADVLVLDPFRGARIVTPAALCTA